MQNFLILSFLPLLFTSTISVAQYGNYVGLRAGLAYNSLRLEDANDVDGEISVAGGAYAQKGITKSLALEAGLMVQKAKSDLQFDNTFNLETETTIDAMTIPVSLKLRLPLFNGRFMPGVFIGQQVRFILDESTDYRSVNFPFSEEFSPEQSLYNAIDWGSFLGLSIDAQSDRVALGLGLSYGFSNIDLSSNDEFGRGSWQSLALNSTFGIALGR